MLLINNTTSLLIYTIALSGGAKIKIKIQSKRNDSCRIWTDASEENWYRQKRIEIRIPIFQFRFESIALDHSAKLPIDTAGSTIVGIISITAYLDRIDAHDMSDSLLGRLFIVLIDCGNIIVGDPPSSINFKKDHGPLINTWRKETPYVISFKRQYELLNGNYVRGFESK